MKRRDLIMLLGGAAAWPVVARAQQAMPVVGVLNSSTAAALNDMIKVLQEGMSELGFHEGQNIRFEFRWADGRYERISSLASDLVDRRVKLLIATGDTAWIAKTKTGTIPIVFVNGSDPVEANLVPSLSRPGGNVTGASWTSNPLTVKRMELLRDLVPKFSIIGTLVNPDNPSAGIDIRGLQTASQTIGVQLVVFKASTMDEIDVAFASMARQRIDAIVGGADSFFGTRRREIVSLAARYKIPMTHSGKDTVIAGGLMSYAAVRAHSFQLAGTYAGRILKGENPADLPVQLPTKFELAINLKTAKTLGLTVPPTLLALADEVIE